jgi:N-succinyldiaminopimelate aminotransferase
MAAAISMDDLFYAGLRNDYERRRSFLETALTELDFEVIRPAGTYFLNIRIDRNHYGDDEAFSNTLMDDAGVASIPTSFFYKERSGGRDMVRFCFCKTDDTLQQAVERLRTWRTTGA